jgi:hypothetical protein
MKQPTRPTARGLVINFCEHQNVIEYLNVAINESKIAAKSGTIIFFVFFSVNATG